MRKLLMVLLMVMIMATSVLALQRIGGLFEDQDAGRKVGAFVDPIDMATHKERQINGNFEPGIFRVGIDGTIYEIYSDDVIEVRYKPFSLERRAKVGEYYWSLNFNQCRVYTSCDVACTSQPATQYTTKTTCEAANGGTSGGTCTDKPDACYNKDYIYQFHCSGSNLIEDLNRCAPGTECSSSACRPISTGTTCTAPADACYNSQYIYQFSCSGDKLIENLNQCPTGTTCSINKCVATTTATKGTVIYTNGDDWIAAKITITNSLSDPISGRVSLEVTTEEEAKARKGFGPSSSCENKEDIQKTFSIAPGKSESTTLTSTNLPKGTYSVNVISINRCCKYGCDPVAPFGWGDPDNQITLILPGKIIPTTQVCCKSISLFGTPGGDFVLRDSCQSNEEQVNTNQCIRTPTFDLKNLLTKSERIAGTTPAFTVELENKGNSKVSTKLEAVYIAKGNEHHYDSARATLSQFPTIRDNILKHDIGATLAFLDVQGVDSITACKAKEGEDFVQAIQVQLEVGETKTIKLNPKIPGSDSKFSDGTSNFDPTGNYLLFVGTYNNCGETHIDADGQLIKVTSEGTGKQEVCGDNIDNNDDGQIDEGCESGTKKSLTLEEFSDLKFVAEGERKNQLKAVQCDTISECNKRAGYVVECIDFDKVKSVTASPIGREDFTNLFERTWDNIGFSSKDGLCIATEESFKEETSFCRYFNFLDESVREENSCTVGIIGSIFIMLIFFAIMFK